MSNIRCRGKKTRDLVFGILFRVSNILCRGKITRHRVLEILFRVLITLYRGKTTRHRVLEILLRVFNTLFPDRVNGLCGQRQWEKEEWSCVNYKLETIGGSDYSPTTAADAPGREPSGVSRFFRLKVLPFREFLV
jgi:hypothetical protein